MKVYNPKTKKNQNLFETLIPVFTVGCDDNSLVYGDNGCEVYINVSAENEELAKEIAIANEEFMSHIYEKDNFDKKYLSVFKPQGSYVIGKVTYYEGDPKL